MPFSRFWDVTRNLSDSIYHWPGDTPFTRTVRQTKKGGQLWSNSELCLGAHTGTHMDAPLHVYAKGGDINSIPLSTLVGSCRVVQTDGEVIDGDFVSELAPLRGERILFKTSNSALFSDNRWHEQFVHFTKSGARALVDAQVVLVGIDGPSVDAFEADGAPAHTSFCGAGIAVIEALDLSEVAPDTYILICLPMKIDGTDGAPVRAILAK